jgi:HlyD family secretion protein
MKTSSWLRRSALVAIPIIVLGSWTLRSFRGAANVHVTTASVTDGPIVRQVVVRGTLLPVTTVDVGSQLSGTVVEVAADYNAVVRTGQVLFRLDPGSFAAARDAARAALAQADAGVTSAKTAADGAETALTRAEDLSMKLLLPQADLDSARAAMAQADADAEEADARAAVARAEVEQAEANLKQTIIRSPVDGVVIARRVGVGMVVASDPSSPALFQIATDFRNMEVRADVDGSDVGAIRIGEPARFAVKAYPDRTFDGRVSELRMDAEGDAPALDAAKAPRLPPVAGTASPAPSYPVVISVANPDETLRPGMTAIVTLDGARRAEATRIPNSALAFAPSEQVLDAAHQDPPEIPSIGSAIEPGAPARVWEYDGVQFTPIAIRIGLGDDEWTELISGPIRPGVSLITSADVIPTTTAH